MSNEKYAALYKAIAIKTKKLADAKFNSTGKLFPSSSGVNCELFLRYNFTGAEKNIDFVWHGIENKIGDAIHAQIQKSFKEHLGDKVEIEKYITIVIEGLKINGKVDMILDGDKIIEIKTVKANEGKEPAPEHIAQVQWYMGVLGLKKAVISYFNRENGIHIQSFTIEYDERAFEKIKEKFARVIRGDKNLRSDNRECKYCPYKKICPSYKFVPKWTKK